MSDREARRALVELRRQGATPEDLVRACLDLVGPRAFLAAFLSVNNEKHEQKNEEVIEVLGRRDIYPVTNGGRALSRNVITLAWVDEVQTPPSNEIHHPPNLPL